MLGGGRHHGIQLPQRSERHLRRFRQGQTHARIYSRLTGSEESFDDVLYASKRLIMATAMASRLNVLTHILDRIGESNRKSRDFTLESMREVITEVVACFPVYRTYVDERGWSPEDRAVVERPSRARRRNRPWNRCSSTSSGRCCCRGMSRRIHGPTIVATAIRPPRPTKRANGCGLR